MTVGHNRGFSLLELFVCLLLISLTLHLALPGWNRLLERHRLAVAAETLYGQLQLSKILAIKLNQSVRLSFQLKTSNEWCYGISISGCNCWQNNACLVNGKNYRNLSTEHLGISISGSSNPWSSGAVFEPRQGNITAGGVTFSSEHYQIRLKTSGQGRIRICNDHSLQSKLDLDSYPVCN